MSTKPFDISSPIKSIANARSLIAFCTEHNLTEQVASIEQILAAAGEDIKIHFSQGARKAIAESEVIRVAVFAQQPASTVIDPGVGNNADVPPGVKSDSKPAVDPALRTPPKKAAAKARGLVTGATNASKEAPGEKAEAREQAKKAKAMTEAVAKYGTAVASEVDCTCLCGCGAELAKGKNFKPGHDAGLRSKVRKVAEGLLPAHVVPDRAIPFLTSWDHITDEERAAFFQAKAKGSAPVAA